MEGLVPPLIVTHVVQDALLAVYLVVWVVFAVYGLHRIHLIRLYRRRNRDLPPLSALEVWPRVTVQLPIYNERYVVNRLLEAAARSEGKEPAVSPAPTPKRGRHAPAPAEPREVRKKK